MFSCYGQHFKKGLLIIMMHVYAIHFRAIFLPDPKDGSLYAMAGAHDGLKVSTVHLVAVNFKKLAYFALTK